MGTYWTTVAAWVQIGVAVIGTGVAIVGTILLLRSLRYSRDSTDAAAASANAAVEQNKLNREFFIAEQGAQIVIRNEQFISPLCWKGRRAIVGFQLQVGNIGRTPAVNVSTMVRLSLERRPREVYEEMRSLIAGRKGIGGYTIAQGGNRIVTHELQITDEQVNKYIMDNNASNLAIESVGIFPYLICCVTYQLVFPGQLRHTGFIYTVMMRVGPGHSATEARAIKVLQEVPGEKLCMLQDPLGGGTIVG